MSKRSAANGNSGSHSLSHQLTLHLLPSPKTIQNKESTYLCQTMPKQSTRHSYKSRRERNDIASRRFKQILLFAVLIGIMLLLRNWREYYNYFITYFNGL